MARSIENLLLDCSVELTKLAEVCQSPYHKVIDRGSLTGTLKSIATQLKHCRAYLKQTSWKALSPAKNDALNTVQVVKPKSVVELSYDSPEAMAMLDRALDHCSSVVSNAELESLMGMEARALTFDEKFGD